jgi:hypothetical protein
VEAEGLLEDDSKEDVDEHENDSSSRGEYTFELLVVVQACVLMHTTSSQHSTKTSLLTHPM